MGNLQSRREGLFANDLSQTKVGDLDIQLLVDEQNVLWLDVAMDDVSLMLKNISKIMVTTTF